LAEVDELCLLRLADDQLCAVLDRLVVVREAERERVAGVIGPLDDLDQLALEEVDDAHLRILVFLASGGFAPGPPTRSLAVAGSRVRGFAGYSKRRCPTPLP